MKKIVVLFLLISLFNKVVFSQDKTTENICNQIFFFATNAVFDDQSNIQTYRIGVFGKSSVVYNYLVQNFKQKKINGKQVIIENVIKIGELNQRYHVLYVDVSKNKSLQEIYNQIAKKGTLLITFQANDSKYLMINLSGDGTTYQIQSLNLIDEKIKFPEKIIATGGSKFDLKDLYEQKVGLLNEKAKEIEIKDKELVDRKKNLDSLTIEVNNQKQENTKKEQLLNEKNQQLDVKQKEIEKQAKELNLQNIHIRFQRRIIITTIVFVVILIFLSLIIYRQLHKNKLMMIEIRQKNEEIMIQNEHIEMQSKEIEKQRDLAVDRGNELEHKNKDIQDSIFYALRIQQALLPDANILSKMFVEQFVFYKPRDIVSGDFYWAISKNEKSIVVAADCTGHGVPGAMMSMLGMSFLNEIVEQYDNCNASFILEKLSALIVKSLKQNINDEKSTSDGIDMSLIIFDKKDMTIHYSGANNSIFVVCQNEPKIVEGVEKMRVYNSETSKNRLFEILADKKPIGIYYGNPKPFVEKIIKVEKNSAIYMYSDGFQDMYNYKINSKYSSKRFKNFLLNVSENTMSMQLGSIEKEYNNWLDGCKQIDDILVIGLRI